MRYSLKKILRITLKVIACFLLASVLVVLLFRFVNPPFTPLMIIRYIQADPGKGKIQKEWKDIEEIAPDMALAVVAAEDQKFFEHNGFDIESIKKALESNQKGNRIRGASTLSQQVAKNVFLWPSRTWIRKGLEAYFTVLIELFWNKKRILEIYLNVAETGQGIYGAEAAALVYFNKSAYKLNRYEAALIAGSLPNPGRFSPARPSAYLIKRRGWILSQMKNLGGQLFLEKHLE